MKPQGLWVTAANQVEICDSNLGEGILLHALYSGISRGTESIVFYGNVPESEFDRMRAPCQEGEFSFPVKYGYSSVGKIMEGENSGRLAFSLHPHQDVYRVPQHLIHLLPESLPAERAVLAANMETALNVVWDSGALPGDRIAVIGAGVVGALVGYLLAKIPGTEVTLIDLNPARESLARSLGCNFALPEVAPKECDLVIHTSGSEAGLQLALEIAGQEAKIVEASWYGSKMPALPLGGAFHSRRLKIVSSQVGNISPNRAPRWSLQRRMAKALELLADPILESLISGETQFSELPASYAGILTDPNTLCHRVRY